MDEYKGLTARAADFQPFQVYVFKSDGKVQMMRSSVKPTKKDLDVLGSMFAPQFHPMVYQVDPKQAALWFRGKSVTGMYCYKVVNNKGQKLSIDPGNLLWDYQTKLQDKVVPIHYVMMRI